MPKIEPNPPEAAKPAKAKESRKKDLAAPPAEATAVTQSEPRSPYSVEDRAPTAIDRQGEAIPLRRRTPDEQLRYRRRMNVLFALAGLALLIAIVAILLRLGP